MTKVNVHVTKNDDCGWKVLKEGDSKPVGVHNTQKEAIAAAREIAIKLESEVVIHGEDGKIRDKDSYGNDPKKVKDSKY